jgi:hypothetical protein
MGAGVKTDSAPPLETADFARELVKKTQDKFHRLFHPRGAKSASTGFLHDLTPSAGNAAIGRVPYNPIKLSRPPARYTNLITSHNRRRGALSAVRRRQRRNRL